LEYKRCLWLVQPDERSNQMRIWVLTHVKRGFIQEPEIFCDANRANRRRQKLSKDLNPDYDELAIFEKEIEITAAQQPK